MYDLLHKPDLKKKDVKRIKKVAVELLDTVRSEQLRVDQWREKEATRGAVRQAIHDFPYCNETGLPVESYDEEEVKVRAEEVFRHIYREHPKRPHPSTTRRHE